MKITRRFAVPLMALLLAAPVSARDVTVFVNGASEGQKFSVQLLDKIYFDSGKLVFNHDGQETSVPLSIINKISFDNTATGIGPAAATADGVKAFVSGNEIRLVGYNHAKPLAAALYGVNGTRVMSVKALDADAIDIASLPKGLYILKLGNSTFKLYK